jgi:hypothetical protein
MNTLTPKQIRYNRLLSRASQMTKLLAHFGANNSASAGYFKQLLQEMELFGAKDECPFELLTAGHCPIYVVDGLRERFGA